MNFTIDHISIKISNLFLKPLLLLGLVALTLASPWRGGWGGRRGYGGGWGRGRGYWGRKRRSAEEIAPVEEVDAVFDIDFEDDAFAGPLLRNKRSPGPWRGGYGYGGYGGWGGYGGYGRYWG